MNVLLCNDIAKMYCHMAMYNKGELK